MQHPAKKENKKQRKLKIILPVLGAVLLLAVAATIWLVPALVNQHQKSTQVVQLPENPVRNLYDTGENAVTAVVMTPYSGESYQLVTQDGKLYLSKNNQLLEIKEEASDELLDIFTHYTVQDTIAESSEGIALEDMGLSPAQARAEVSYSDGSVLKLELGISIPETSYSYMRWSRDDGIYAADEGIRDAFGWTADRLLPLTQPEIISDLVEEVEIENDQGSLSFRVEVDSEEVSAGWLTKPYLYPMDGDVTDAVLQSLSSFRLGSVQSQITDENAAEFGFDPYRCKLVVKQGEGYQTQTDETGSLVLIPVKGKTITIEFGNETDEHFVYCRYGGRYYLVSKYLIQPIWNLSWKSAVTTQPLNLGDSSLQSLVFQAGEQRWELQASYTENVLENNDLETDSSGQVVYTAEYTLNGKSLTQEQMDSIVSSLQAITTSGWIEDGWTAQTEPIWSLALTTVSGDTREIRAYAVNTFSTAFSLNGVFLQTLRAETLETLTSLFQLDQAEASQSQ